MTLIGTSARSDAAAVHRLGAGHQPVAHRAGDRGEDDVVDGAAVEARARRGSPAASVFTVMNRRCSDSVVLIGESGAVRRFDSAPAT